VDDRVFGIRSTVSDPRRVATLTGSATSTAEVDLEGRAPELAAAAALLDDPEDRITATEAA
jgi:hypothetical protein